MLCACYCSIPIVAICDVFFFMLEIALGIRFSVMYDLSHMFCNFTIKVFSRGLSFYHILIDADWNTSNEEANWYLEQPLIFFKCYNFNLFSIRGLLKLFLIFPCHIILLIIIVLHLLLCGVLNLTFLTKSFICIYKFHILHWFFLTDYLFHFWIYELQVIFSGDVELKPGPKPK